MRKKTTLYIEEENKKKLKILATIKGGSSSDIVDELVSNYIEENNDLLKSLHK